MGILMGSEIGKRSWLVGTTILLALLTSACGYHTASKASLIPTDVKTIAIPSFVNQTQTYRIESILTEAVVREFNTRTKFRIVSDPEGADAVLRGTVTSTQLAPVTYDSNTGRASSALVTVNMKVLLTEKDGKVLYENSNYVFREQYQVSRELSSFFEEEGPAVDRLSRDFARTLVSNVLEMY
jgi:outer membrane lipopolysaccharide assembly protein LptE/RlpB